jgi:hypothetical protein
VKVVDREAPHRHAAEDNPIERDIRDHAANNVDYRGDWCHGLVTLEEFYPHRARCRYVNGESAEQCIELNDDRRRGIKEPERDERGAIRQYVERAADDACRRNPREVNAKRGILLGYWCIVRELGEPDRLECTTNGRDPLIPVLKLDDVGNGGQVDADYG